MSVPSLLVPPVQVTPEAAVALVEQLCGLFGTTPEHLVERICAPLPDPDDQPGDWDALARILISLCLRYNTTLGGLYEKAVRAHLMERCFCGWPEDRLYHARERSWWARDAQGNLVRSEPPVDWKYAPKEVPGAVLQAP